MLLVQEVTTADKLKTTERIKTAHDLSCILNLTQANGIQGSIDSGESYKLDIKRLLLLRNFAKNDMDQRTQYMWWLLNVAYDSNSIYGNAPPITKLIDGVETIIAPSTAAIEKWFGRNAATKKTQRNILKQQYENFTASSSGILDQTFDRLQKLISQLEINGESISQEDVNQKFLRSLSPE
ncbi:hypothetical protein Tco_0661264 [Tanacetum coccineum]